MTISRRAFSTILLLGLAEIAKGASIVAVRVWPAKDYTRLTIESDTLLSTKQVFVTDPPRLAVDIVGIDLNPELRALVAKVKSDDPFIQGVRVGQNAPGVVRLVLDLKQAAKPQVFTLPPVAAYQYRLVIDLYPAEPIDPMATLKEDLKDDPLGDLIASKAKEKPSPPVAALPKPTTSSSVPPVFPAPLPVPVPQSPSAKPTTTAPTMTKTDRLIIVAIDPGHGGEDPGAIGPAGTKEKDVVLQIAQRLQERLNDENHTIGNSTLRAFLTRDGDYFVPLHQRVQKAQRVQADIFISVHADAFFTPTARGASVFALSERGASSSAAKWIADKENKADSIGGLNVKVKDVAVKRVLFDMSTTAQIKDSLNLGSGVIAELSTFAKLHKPKVEQASFAVLKAPDIPSILIETAFISHPEEEQKLKDPEYQEQLTNAILRGLTRYFAKHPPLARQRHT